MKDKNNDIFKYTLNNFGDDVETEEKEDDYIIGPCNEGNNDVFIIKNTEEAKHEWHKNWFGSRDLEISKKQLDALINGNALATNDGEYSWTISLKKEAE